MEIISYVIAAAVGFFGLMFIIGAQGQVARFVVGIVLLLASGALIYATRARPRHEERTIVQKIDLTGDVALEQFKCRNCGGALDKESIEVRAGAVHVDCPYCGATYQVEEEPKW
jgi:hypothetical protein